MINDLVAKWLMPALKRAMNNAQQKEEVSALRSSRTGNDLFDGCDSIQFRVMHLSNGTVIRMDNWGPQDDYVVKNTRPRAPHIFIVKDNETVQDAIVRMLAIHQLEKQ